MSILKNKRVATWVFLCLITLVTSCQNSSPSKVHLENDNYNFDFEEISDNKWTLPWRFYSNKDIQIDSVNQYSGNYCLHLLNKEAYRNTGLGYMTFLPIPEEIETIRISCKINKLSNGRDTFYLTGLTQDISTRKNSLLTYDSLSIDGGIGWQNFTLDIKNDTTFSSFYFSIETIGSSDFYVDDFKVTYDGIPFSEHKFFTELDIDLLEKYSKPFENKPLNKNVHDLAFLSSLVKDKKIIGLGEPNHGNREIFQIKSRIVKFLSKNDGFNTFVFEDETDNINRVNDYLINEMDDRPVDSLMVYFKHLFQIEEIKELVVWLKNYNNGKVPNEKIYFLGCDMQDDKQSIQYLKEFALEEDNKLYSLILAYEEEYKVYENLKIIKQIQNHLITKQSLEDEINHEYNRLLHSSKILEQFAIFDANLGNRSIHRDSSMANNILWISNNYPKRKLFYWADNTHVKKKAITSAGGYLAKKLGEEYYVIGTAVGKGKTKGKFDENANLTAQLFPSRREYFLNAAKDSIYFLPLEKFRLELQDIKENYHDMNRRWEFDLFDAMIYIENVSASRKIKYY